MLIKSHYMQHEEYKNYLIAKGYSKASTAKMKTAAVHFLQWINKQGIEITTVTYNDVTAYIKSSQHRSIKTRTVEIITGNIKHYFEYLVDAGIVTHNPVLKLKIRNAKRKVVYNILSPEELENIYKSYRSELPSKTNAPPQTLNRLARKRNKVLVGLFIYQGITTEDVKSIELKNLELREGKITIPGTRRSNERTLKLEPHQIFDLYDYVNETRKEILRLTKKQSTTLFISIGTGSNMLNMIAKLMEELKEQHPNVESIDQIRASIITHWLKQYNKRKVQYMAGHRYISSTERYEASNIEELQDDIEKYYPVL